MQHFDLAQDAVHATQNVRGEREQSFPNSSIPLPPTSRFHSEDTTRVINNVEEEVPSASTANFHKAIIAAAMQKFHPRIMWEEEKEEEESVRNS